MNNYNGDDVEHWTVDKKIPLALIMAILMQTIAGVWWAATTTARLQAVEITQNKNMDLAERVIRLEIQLQTQTNILEDIRDELREKNASKR